MPQSANRILNALPQEVFATIQPQLKPVKLSFAEVIAETDQSITQVYFPFSGVVSLVVAMNVGDMIETAMVGRDGVVNGTSALDGRTALYTSTAIAQLLRRTLSTVPVITGFYICILNLPI